MGALPGVPPSILAMSDGGQSSWQNGLGGYKGCGLGGGGLGEGGGGGCGGGLGEGGGGGGSHRQLARHGNIPRNVSARICPRYDNMRRAAAAAAAAAAACE